MLLPRKDACLTFVILIIFGFLSCTSTKKAIYFKNVQDSAIGITATNLEPFIQKNDLLSISVSSVNPEAAKAFNVPNTNAIGPSSQASGYLVSQQGTLKFPVLGVIKAVGMTKTALADYISTQLIQSKQLYDPIVDVRYLNFRVTVLGEVGHPQVVNVANEKITLLEALGLAGDITLYAKRDNVLLIRDEEGKRVIRRLNLNDDRFLTSPYYFLKSNDIIYVEPNKVRVASTRRMNLLLPVLLSGLSVVIIALDRILR